MDFKSRSEQLVDQTVDQLKENHMFIGTLSLKQLRKLQKATQEFILEQGESQKISQVLKINQQVKEKIAVFERQEEKLKKQEEFQKTHSSIIDDIIDVISHIGPQSPFGEKRHSHKEDQ